MASLCPLCECRTPSIYLYSKKRIPIYRCPNCGAGRADIADFDAASYYDTSYFNGQHSDGYAGYVQASNVLRTQFRKDIALIEKLGVSGRNLVELGCAYGFFLDEARAKSYEISGLELCEDAVKDCQSRGHRNVYRKEISKESLSLFSKADVVVMLDVIEHLPDPVAAVEAIANLLNPGGVLLMTTGDFASGIAKITGEHWRLMTPPQHLWFFTPNALKTLCARFGLELIYLDHPWKKVPIGLAFYQALRYLSISPNLPEWTHRFGVPINLFDAMRLAFRKRITA
jgi:SAM-dependent methyltransferase